MPITNADLWPDDIAYTDIVSPASVLREQAAHLGTKTKNLVEGKVEAFPTNRPQEFGHAFYLVAPALANYRYRLFTIEHPVEFYPLVLHFEAADKEFKVPRQEEFVTTLGQVFGDEKTKSIIKALLAQSLK